MKHVFSALLFLSFLSVYAQCIVPFQDFNNFVYLFDAGQSNYIENLPLQSIKVGRNNVVAYVGQNGRMKVYFKGQIFTIADNAPNYYMTDNWMLYQNFNQIKVLYNNEFKLLENFFRPDMDSLYYSDSLVAWTNALGELNIFYNGTTQILERTEIRRAKAGDNMFAYIDRNGNFKVFYQGEIKTLEVYEPPNFLVNRDMMVYIDMYDYLKFFHDGVLSESTIPTPNIAITSFKPSTVFPVIDVGLSFGYWSGEGFAAYMTQLKQLAVYYKGEQTILVEDRPANMLVKENLIAWVDKGNNFWCWYKGKKYWLERYVPQSVEIDNNIIVYHDINLRLKAFYYGEQVEVSDQMVKKFTLWNEAVSYSIQPYQTKIWCNKKTYTFE